MRYFRVKAFTGIQNQAEESDQDRGSLTICENADPYPKGCLRAAPLWTRVYENYSFSSGYSACALQDANDHRVVVTKDGSSVTGLGWYPNNATVNKLPSGSTLTETATSSAMSGKIFINRVGSEFFLGNGAQDNLRWGSDTSFAFQPLAATSSYYAQAHEVFPACTSFVVGPDKAVYAGGNESNPLRVYVSEPATIANPDADDAVQGVFSGILSSVDIIMSEATRITSLSSFRNYVVVHTDAGVALLYRTDKTQAGTGFRVRQTASPTVSGALNPNCTSASMGVRPFYLGTDGQIYKDEAARASQDHVTEGRVKEILSWKSVSGWDRYVDKDLTDSFTAYEPSSEFFAAFVPHLSGDTAKGFPCFLYNGETFQLSGPNLYPRFQAVTRVEGTSALLGIDHDRNFWTTDLDQLREPAPFNVSTPVPAQQTPKVWIHHGEAVSSTVLGAGNAVLVNAQGVALAISGTAPGDVFNAFVEQESPASPINYEGPFSEPVEAPLATTGMTEYTASTLSVIETAYEDMGTPEGNKNFMEVVLKFKTGSMGHMAVYAQTENGLSAGRWMGDISTSDTHKLFINLRGKQLKLRIYIVSRVNATWLLKDLSTGFIIQNTL